MKNWLIIISCILLITSCSQEKRFYHESGSMFHTLYNIKYESKRPLTAEIDSAFARFNLSLNPFNKESIIAKVNNNQDVVVDEWFTTVFNKSMEISKTSNGMFDITCAPLVNVWGFGFKKKEEVTPALIDSILAFVGYQKVKLENGHVIKQDPRLMLNCSSIAKGFSCDVIAQLLEKEGIENYMVEIGGEVCMKGVNPKGNCWRIGINKPNDDNKSYQNETEEVLQLCKKGAIATSGDYRNFYVKDGKKYAHTINPQTGYPAEQNILSATIVADNCMTADAYATACMSMGLNNAKLMMKDIPNVYYFFIYSDENGKHQEAYSPELVQYMPNRKEMAILENP